MRPCRLPFLMLAMAGVILVALAGCSTGPVNPPASPSPTFQGIWAKQCDDALANPNLSDFQRQILATHWVTDAQYQAARNGFVGCMADRGWIVILNPAGGYNMQSAPDAHQGMTDAQQMDANGKDTQECQNEFMSWVAPLYEQSKTNPQGLTFGQQLRTCYAAHNVPDGAGLSDDAFEALVTDPNYHASTPEGVLCWWDPTGSLGMTVEQAEAQEAQRTPAPSSGPGAPTPGTPGTPTTTTR